MGKQKHLEHTPQINLKLDVTEQTRTDRGLASLHPFT